MATKRHEGTQSKRLLRAGKTARAQGICRHHIVFRAFSCLFVAIET